MERKKQTRAAYQNIRRQLSQEQKQEKSKKICERLRNLSLFQKADTVYFYYPLADEVSLLMAAKEALNQGKCVGFPKTEGDCLGFYQVKALSDFTEGVFHVMEPVSQVLLQESTPLILAPGSAFDREKNRIGYGKGYYDRYLLEFPEAVTIGIAYQCQIAETIPHESYDKPMDYMLTEEGFW